MSALQKKYRRNFAVAVVLHVVIVGALVLMECLNLHGNVPRPVVMAVELGDAPVGNGVGLGKYKSPEPAGLSGPSAGATVAKPTPAPAHREDSSEDVSEPVAPSPKVSAIKSVQKNEIAVPVKPKKPAPETKAKTPTPEPTTAAANKPTSSTAKQTSTVSNKTKTSSSSSATSNAPGSGRSASDIQRDFAKALGNSPDGTSRGDGTPGGGGKGKGPIGRADGTKDGVPFGHGKGTPNSGYFMHIHDVLYEAWNQSNGALDKNLITTIQLRIARDGTITDCSVRISSGNHAMDESVVSAVRRVFRLDPPPADLVVGNAATIPVEFQVEG